MNNILDKSLDSQFDKIENLTWFPWVGKGYKCAKRKLLVVGESHYLNEDSDENNEKRRELLIRDKEHSCYDIAFGEKQHHQSLRMRRLQI